MAGSLRLVKAPDVYELRVYVGRDSSGRVKHRYERFTGNKRSAQRALAALVTEVEQAKENKADPVDIWASSTTLNAAFAAWKLNGWQDLSPSTTRRYESIWHVHVERSIGLRKISELSAYDFERFFRKLKADGLTEASVRQTRADIEPHLSPRPALEWRCAPEPGRRDRAAQLVDGRGSRRAGARGLRGRSIASSVRR